jgi:hypothetical protein
MADRRAKYEPDPTVYAELNMRLEGFQLSEEQGVRVEIIRQKARDLMMAIANETPESGEQDLAYDAVELCIYHSTAAIARRERRP